MNFRQRLLAVLNGEQPDIMPWFADLSYWYTAQRLAGTLPSEYEGDAGYIKLHVDHNVGYYLGYVWATTDTYQNVAITRETEGPVTTTRWATPVGEIVDQDKFLAETASSAPVKWPVATLDDLQVLRYIADATRSESNYDQFEILERLANGHDHPTVLPPRSPVSQMLAQWTGVTNFAYLLTDAPQEVELTLDALARAADGAYNAILSWDTPFVELPDNLTGEVITPWFEQVPPNGDMALVRLAGDLCEELCR